MSPRAKAFLIHFGCSMAVAMALLLLVFAIWYPTPLDRALGVREIFLILLGVDVILGPMLTLVVYKPGKKGLFFDVSVIVFCQVAALAYGLHAVALGRPAWLVFNVDRFDIVRAYEVDNRQLHLAAPEFRAPSYAGPIWVAAISPDDISTKQQILRDALEGGPDLQQRPEHYQPLVQNLKAVQDRMRNVEELKRFNLPDAVAAQVATFPEAAGWLPLMGRDQAMVVLLDKSGQVLGLVELSPW